ncbi:MAG: hypothetical protein A2W26_05095 [Acidobacteria bacterium RBG_16_64_8]|nr:MAG: hypothetical protein A2W26_05095 [Acidobacteria bacterium RBG_16_64_8]
MKREGYAHDPLLFYPGRRLSEDEKRRIDNFDLPIDEVTVDHLVYSLARQIENNFQTFYAVAEEIVGEEAALKIAYEIGLRYGGRGYAAFLEARGRENDGDPRTMVLYQDFVHSIRGPKHTSALYAEYDDTRCVVKRQQCIYYSETYPQNGKYTGAFEAGCFEGYKRADKNLLRVEVHKCRWKGDASCEQHWVYKGPVDREDSPANSR